MANYNKEIFDLEQVLGYLGRTINFENEPRAPEILNTGLSYYHEYFKLTKKLKQTPAFVQDPAVKSYLDFQRLVAPTQVNDIISFFRSLEEEPEEEPEIDFDVSIAVDVVAPGETLYINNDFINFPEKRSYSITIYYTINDKQTLTRVDSWQISIDSTDSILEAKSVKHTIPRTTEPGKYELNVKLSYSATTKQLYEYFTVSTSEEEIAQAE